MNIAGAFVLCVLIVLILTGSRRWATLGLVSGVLFLSEAQQVNVAGINLFAIRFLEMAGFIRVCVRREVPWHTWNRLDWTLASLYAFTTSIYLLRSGDGYASAIALAVDAGLCYLTFRGLIQNLGDFVLVLRALPFVLIPFLGLLAFERRTGHVPFSFMSSGLEGIFVRDGVPRCMGAFRNPDLLGTFGATFLPCYLALVWFKPERPRGILGVFLCGLIVWFSHSGGALSSAGVAAVGWAAWKLRDQMRPLRWLILAAIGVLALVMKAPVWYLLDRVSAITGGTGWHRAYLIDVAVRHLPQWWLAGMPIRNTQDWFFYTIGVTGGADITNQYILFGLTAGVGAMALLILVLVSGFSRLGTAVWWARRLGESKLNLQLMFWGMGVMLAVHMINWLGISYFDQIYVIWLLQLAAISGATAMVPCLRKLTSPVHDSRTSEQTRLSIGPPAAVRPC